MTDIAMRAGDSRILEFTVQEADATPTDLSGATARWGIAPPPIEAGAIPYAGKPVLTIDAAPGLALLPNGLVRVTIGKGQVPAGTWVYELEVTFPGGVSETVAAGTLTAAPSVFPD